jgi:hypothetical protein
MTPQIDHLDRPSLATRFGRWLLRTGWTLQSNLLPLMSNLGVPRHRAKTPYGKLRGPIVWLGDLRKRKDQQDT